MNQIFSQIVHGNFGREDRDFPEIEDVNTEILIFFTRISNQI